MMDTARVSIKMSGSISELVVNASMSSTTTPAAIRYIHSSSNTVS